MNFKIIREKQIFQQLNSPNPAEVIDHLHANESLYTVSSNDELCFRTYLLCNGSGHEGTSLLIVAKEPLSLVLEVLFVDIGVFSIASIFSFKYLASKTLECRAEIVSKIKKRHPT
ncbi:hypothetical protein L1049_019506 [Liquidambar formosana]|uniref:Uncharacterized protein n=1 Tax=Liquidambar formosana TaxID=63359 RepID=A0AAP0X6I7_LIQFO